MEIDLQGFFYSRKGFWEYNCFFMISGFVILMSLQKSNSFMEFMYKRWIRLFPAMLIATILIFFTASYLPERPNGMPRLLDVIPGLTFIQANDIKKIFHIDVLDLENPFWSLYVEVKFYIIFGILYFYFGIRRAILSIFGLFLLSLLLDVLMKNFVLSNTNFLVLILRNLYASNYGWFASGAMAYLYYINKSKKSLLYSVIFGLISVVVYRDDIVNMVFMFILLTIFISTIYFEKIGKLFENRFLVFYGFISYPLYLIHENAMIGLIIKIRTHISFIPEILLPLLPIIFLSAISYLIAKLLEPFIRKLINDNLQIFFQRKFKLSIDSVKKT